MNREILFRGKIVDNNEWVYGLFIYHNGEYKFYGSNGEFYEVIPESIGQFTGLTDRNEKKIFENDKLFLRGHECIVAYRKNYCDFTFENIKYGGRSLNVTKSNITKYDLEIIGNIHETNK